MEVKRSPLEGVDKICILYYKTAIKIYQREVKMSWYQHMARRRPAFIIGVARLLDVCRVLSIPLFKKTNNHYEPIQDDETVLYKDWALIGNDIKIAIGKFDQAE